MRMWTRIAAITAVASLPAIPLVAQDHAVILRAYGGGYSALSDVNDNPLESEFDTGFNVGGGAAVQLNRYVAVRADFTYGRSELRTREVDTGMFFDKFFYGGDIQLRYPTRSGFAPYVFGGGGAVTVHQENTGNIDKTKGAGRFGAGFSYDIPHSRLALFGEGTGWAYKVDNFSGRSALAGFDKTQVDVVYSGGLSYRLPF